MPTQCIVVDGDCRPPLPTHQLLRRTRAWKEHWKWLREHGPKENTKEWYQECKWLCEEGTVGCRTCFRWMHPTIWCDHIKSSKHANKFRDDMPDKDPIDDVVQDIVIWDNGFGGAASPDAVQQPEGEPNSVRPDIACHSGVVDATVSFHGKVKEPAVVNEKGTWAYYNSAQWWRAECSYGCSVCFRWMQRESWSDHIAGRKHRNRIAGREHRHPWDEHLADTDTPKESEFAPDVLHWDFHADGTMTPSISRGTTMNLVQALDEEGRQEESSQATLVDTVDVAAQPNELLQQLATSYIRLWRCPACNVHIRFECIQDHLWNKKHKKNLNYYTPVRGDIDSDV